MVESDKPRHLREIRSFVKREGRMTKGQQRAMDDIFPEMGVNYSEQLLDLEQLFGNQQPVVLEIGFGMGKSLSEQAAANPHLNYFGIEVHKPGVGACLLLAEEYGLKNLRVIQHDAVEVLRHMIPLQSLSGIQIFFPDPWHKKRHHKRRIVQPKFIELCHSRLCANGFMHLATDWENYAEHMLKAMQATEGWKNLSETGDYIPRPDDRPLTKFEHRGEKLGHGVWDLMFEKIG